MIVVSWANLGGLALSLFISGGFCPRTPHGVEVGLPNAGRLSAHQIKEDKSEPLWAPCCCLDRWGGSEPAPMCHISSCNFMESARLPPPPRAKNKYRRLKRFKFVSAIWILSSFKPQGSICYILGRSAWMYTHKYIWELAPVYSSLSLF